MPADVLILHHIDQHTFYKCILSTSNTTKLTGRPWGIMPKATCIMLNQQFLEIYQLCFQKKLYYAHIMLNYVMGFNL